MHSHKDITRQTLILIEERCEECVGTGEWESTEDHEIYLCPECQGRGFHHRRVPLKEIARALSLPVGEGKEQTTGGCQHE